MKFDNAINHLFKKTLKKIRIKVDPLYASSENYMNIDSYTGYVLEEDAESIKVMVIKPGYPVVDIPRGAMMQPTMFDLFKTFIETKIAELGLGSSPRKPLKCTTFETLESTLSNSGFTNKEITKFYRDFLKIYENNE